MLNSKLPRATLAVFLALTLGGCGESSTQAARPPTAATCTDPVSWQDATSMVGQVADVTGPVVSATYAADSRGEPTFLNIGADYPDPSRFTVVIWGKHRARFPTAPEVAYNGSTVCVHGEVTLYEGVGEIEITSPSQIQTAP